MYRQKNAYGLLTVFEDESTDNVQVSKVSKSDLSEDQLAAYDRIESWLKRSQCGVLTLGGYAGTGKTTLVSVLANEMQLRVAFCAYTGKAANVLRQKLARADVEPEYCGTIHRLIYRPVANEQTGEVVDWDSVEDLDYDLIVVDEASMVDEKMFEDLKGYGVPILAVGDHGQLPPVKGQFSLMTSPDVRLEKIHRQAEGNPIIRLSAAIRQRGVSAIDYGSVNSMSSVGPALLQMFRDQPIATSVLCFTNKTRVDLNRSIRRAMFPGEDVMAESGKLVGGDVVVCLKNTKFSKCDYVFNGMRGVVDHVSSVRDPYIQAKIKLPSDGMELKARLSSKQFGTEKTFSSFAEAGLPEGSTWADVGMLFDYGYALTAHKAQGSEFDDVAVLLESMNYMDEDYRRRWLYTSVSRASKNLYLVRR